MRFVIPVAFLFAVSVLCISGCGGKRRLPEGETGSVAGTITTDGQPVAIGGKVVMIETNRALVASGLIATDGTYALQMRGGPEILAAFYAVSITPPPAPALTVEQQEALARGITPDVQTPEWREIPKRYRSAETSGLAFEVKPGVNTFDLDMKK